MKNRISGWINKWIYGPFKQDDLGVSNSALNHALQQGTLTNNKPQFIFPRQKIDNVDIGPRMLFKAPLEANKAHADYREVPYEAPESEANLVSSLTHNGLHMPVLDLDFPAQLIPSSTPGHFHLLLDKEISWMKYQNLLHVLAEAGLLEIGYVEASIAHGGTFIRKPGLKKASPGDDPEFVEAQNKWKKEFGV